MQHLIWSQNGHQYITPITQGRAIINQLDSFAYTAHIETDSGEILRTCRDIFKDFETAESWILFTTLKLEQTETPEIAHDRLFQTLDLCQSLLPRYTHPAHWLRIDHIKQWILYGTQYDMEIASVIQIDQSSNILDWVEDEAEYYVQTKHGQAIIAKIQSSKSPYHMGGTLSYLARIEHSTGAKIVCPNTTTVFLAADMWVQTTLAELDDPRIAEYYLEHIRFTLAICKCVLPPNVEPLHIARLNYLEQQLMNTFL